MVPVVDLVDEKADGPVRVGDDDVGIAVVVDIAKRRAAADLRRLECRTGAIGDVFERATSQILKQLIRLLKRERVVGSEGVKVLGDEAVDGQDVEPAVIVEIEPASAKPRKGETGEPDAGPDALVFE